MRCHQNLKGPKIAFVIVGNQQWPILRRYVDWVLAVVKAATPGSTHPLLWLRVLQKGVILLKKSPRAGVDRR
ncbi:MAG TPA: hypothetical protein VGL34_10475 [Steroidobacteraceae bacterium]